MKRVFVLCALFMSFTLCAQETKEPLSAEIPASVTNLRLAAELSKYGYANKSALSLIQAAQIIAENRFTEESVNKENDTKSQDNDGKNGHITLNVEQLLADATDLADGDESLLSLIANVGTIAQKRGPVDGEKYGQTSVNGNSTDRYTESFIAGQLATVVVIGDGDTDLDLYVYDSNNNLIVKDDDYTDNCYVTWVPKWTGKFYIKVVNRGPLYNRYVIRVK